VCVCVCVCVCVYARVCACACDVHTNVTLTHTQGETPSMFVQRIFSKHLGDMFASDVTPASVALRSASSLEWVYGDFPIATFEYVVKQCAALGKCDLVPAIAYWRALPLVIEPAWSADAALVGAIYEVCACELHACAACYVCICVWSM
jgi:hypothetical protein